MSLSYEVRLGEFMGDRFMIYLRHSELHRLEAPSNIWSDGELYWFHYGKDLLAVC